MKLKLIGGKYRMSAKAIKRIGLGILVGTFMFGMTLYADTLGTINGEDIMLKQAPQIEAEDLRIVEKDSVVRINNLVDDFAEIIHDNTVIGYIESKHITIKEPEPEPEAEAEVKPQVKPAAAVDKGQEIVNFALKHVGNPYVYGGTSLTRGTDCSGFTSSVYKNFGINIHRSSRSQYAGSGKPVSKANLQPGDLVFYGYNGRVSHAAIYIGNNKIVHASTPKTGICVSPLQQRGMTPYIGAKRII